MINGNVWQEMLFEQATITGWKVIREISPNPDADCGAMAVPDDVELVLINNTRHARKTVYLLRMDMGGFVLGHVYAILHNGNYVQEIDAEIEVTVHPTTNGQRYWCGS